MTRLHQNRLYPCLTLVIGLLAGLALPQRALAGGWLSLRNDTPHVLLVADSGGPSARHGKTQRLYPGESIVDMQAGNGQRTILISDARSPQRVLVQTTITPKDGATISLSIQPAPSRGVGQPGTAALRLVPLAADAQTSRAGHR